MQTTEIQPQEWQQFFNDFSRKHQGRPVGIEILGSEIGAQIEQSGLVLEGITAESKKVLDSSIMIMIGAHTDEHLTHAIKKPTQVSLKQDGQGEVLALAIKGADGDTALLSFQSPVSWI